MDGEKVVELITQREVQECNDNVEEVLQMRSAFQRCYLKYRSSAKDPPGGAHTMKTAFFARLDSFRARTADMLDFCRIALQFRRLEKVGIGGTKGKALSSSVERIYEEFEEVVDAFQAVPWT